MIIIQLILYCLLFTLMVKLAVRNNAINALYFYPKPVQERAVALGLATREKVSRDMKIFMTAFYLVMLTVLVLIIGLWNSVSDFGTAYLQAVLFLEVMNWYDGIVIDRLWVGYSKLWLIKGTEDIPYIKTWKQVLIKRLVLTLVWMVGGAVVAGMIVLIF
ncbi:MAG: hypothetical protein IJZ47_08170 [Oscillospiraceae bacterium]|nr:hypothetical protein [Oscillospiraceae bacterium]